MQMATGRMWISNHLARILCFTSYKKWVQQEKYQNNTRLPFSTSHRIGRQDKNTFAEQCKILTTKVGELGIIEESI